MEAADETKLIAVKGELLVHGGCIKVFIPFLGKGLSFSIFES